MKIYHYTDLSSWEGIKHGSWKSGNEPGLGDNLRVCKLYGEDEGARSGAVFGLLEPEPTRWTKNTEFPMAWPYLTAHIGKLLLYYEPDDELVDKSFVIDWSHMERSLRGHKDDSPNDEPLSYGERLAAEKAYWESKVPLADLIDSQDAISHIVLPEVITMTRVPAELITIADTQPLLGTSGIAKRALPNMIGQHPELEPLSAHIT